MTTVLKSVGVLFASLAKAEPTLLDVCLQKAASDIASLMSSNDQAAIEKGLSDYATFLDSVVVSDSGYRAPESEIAKKCGKKHGEDDMQKADKLLSAAQAQNPANKKPSAPSQMSESNYDKGKCPINSVAKADDTPVEVEKADSDGWPADLSPSEMPLNRIARLTKAERPILARQGSLAEAKKHAEVRRKALEKRATPRTMK